METIPIMPVVLVGLVATAYLTAVNLVAERGCLVRGNMLRAIGAFVIPEPVRSPVLSAVLHFAAGILFTGVYAYVFGFVEPEQLSGFVSLGLLVGLVHGFFVSYFMILGFSALQPGESTESPGFAAALLNVVAHVVFGVMVGLGLGTAKLSGTVVWFVGYSLAVLAALAGLGALVGPYSRSRRSPPLGEPRRSPV